MKNWDVFISHASEDNQLAEQLANELVEAGVRVWLDMKELQVGDSLTEKIDDGLSKSHFGIVLLSPAFISKNWPRKELNGLFALENGNNKMILPIWHDIDQQKLAQYSPILADRIGLEWNSGIEYIVWKISTLIFEKAKDSSLNMLSMKGRFISLLEADYEKKKIVKFFEFNRDILIKCFGQGRVDSQNPFSDIDWTYQTPSSLMPQKPIMKLLYFCPPKSLPLTDLDTVSVEFVDCFDKIATFPDLKHLFCGKDIEYIIVIGRRSKMDERQRKFILSFNPATLDPRYEEIFSNTKLTVRTYDWLVDLA